ncbi:hypothetical protein [Lactococcus taiwanensis]|uniref:hypothetical protein n=1 Tax=Lactococcus taiwanensis TaxID=1151742 RepID=UPI0035110C49
MNEQELNKLLKQLDVRYVVKEELSTEVLHIVGQRYATREEFAKALGRIDALIEDQQKNTQLLSQIYDFLQEHRENDSEAKIKIKMLEERLNDMDKSAFQLFLERRTPAALITKTAVLAILFYLALDFISQLIGKQADAFMERNGCYVAIVTLIGSYLTASLKPKDKG